MKHLSDAFGQTFRFVAKQRVPERRHHHRAGAVVEHHGRYEVEVEAGEPALHVALALVETELFLLGHLRAFLGEVRSAGGFAVGVAARRWAPRQPLGGARARVLRRGHG